MLKSTWLVLFSACYFAEMFALGNEDSFVITTEPNNDKEKGPKGEENFDDVMVPKIYEMQIESNVSNRFAYTLITSKIRNLNKVAREVTFSVILPDQAYISEFVMVIKGKSYKAYVKEKEKAKKIYDKAVARGLGAAQVALTSKEYSQFTVSVNVEALGKATFLLKYEELLRLKDHQYELVINIQPNQPVNDLYVNVMINESMPLKFIRTAPLRSGNEISKLEGDLDPRASIFRFNAKSALVQFKPNIERQKEFAKYLGTDVSKGLSGQFVVQYDVERDPQGGEVLVKDGYFVHFFAPSEFKPLNKFVVFVLDTGGNMYGQKMAQLKLAMTTILDELGTNDYFHFLSFGAQTNVWNISNGTPKDFGSYAKQNYTNLTNMDFPNASAGHSDNINKTKEVILNLRSGGGSNIYEALQTALGLVEVEKTRVNHEYPPQPIIMCLTNAKPTVITYTGKIITDITNRNGEQTPIYSLSFGDDADIDFLKKLSHENYGFSRHIYESFDAALQVKNFYKEIASPLLSRVKFEYVPDATSVTKTRFPLHFGGSELVVAGKLHTATFPELPRIMCSGRIGPVTLYPTIEKPITSLERLWAYLTIQQLLDKKEESAQNKKKALDLALKYSFVTPISSLIVVKPDSTNCNIDPKRITRRRYSSWRRKQLASSVRYHFRSSFPHGYSSHPVRPHYPYRPYNTRHPYHSYHPSPSRPSYKIQSTNQTLNNLGAGNVTVLKVPEKLLSKARRPHFDLDGKSRSRLVLLKLSIPWLENILNENGTLKSPPGGYELGLSRKFSRKPSCSETPTNTTGRCELLHECPQVHHLLTTEDVFVRYFCPLKRRRREFAGVCCP